jgi:hypothetical protein
MSGFQIEATTTSSSESVTLPFVAGYTFDCYVNYGDGSPTVHVTAWDDANATHVYATADSYTIEITGSCPSWSVNNTHSSRLQWTSILYWGDAVDFDGWQDITGGWFGCYNLGSLGSGSIISDGLTLLNNTFRNAGLSTAGITLPAGLLDNMAGLTTMTSTFLSANLTGEIPDGFFDGCADVTSSFRCLQNCSGLSGEIPSLLLAPMATNTLFSYFFRGCPNLKIRGDIFYADGDQGTRFYDQSPAFDNVFETTGTNLSDNIIPDLWNCDYGTGTPSHTTWITGHSASTATNWKNVPIAWGGDAVSAPVITSLSDDEVYDGQQITISVTDALPFQYNGKVELSDNATYGLGDLVEQTISGVGWNDNQIGITLNFGIIPVGGAYFYVTTDRGDTSNAYPISLFQYHTYTGTGVAVSVNVASGNWSLKHIFSGSGVNVVAATGSGNWSLKHIFSGAGASVIVNTGSGNWTLTTPTLSQIMDLANNTLSTTGNTGQMIGYQELISPEEVLPLDMYRFLLEPIRQADNTREGALFVKRFLQGPQELWKQTIAKTFELKKLHSVTDCPDQYLKYLKQHVGWTEDLNYITDELGYDTLRKLISESPTIWARRGREETIANTLTLLTGAQCLIWNWFDYRWITGETIFGEQHTGLDPWMIDVPGPPDYGEYYSTLRIVDNGDLNRTLTKNIVKFMRVISERIEIVYTQFFDKFNVEGDSTQWAMESGSGDITVANGYASITNSGTSQHAVISNGYSANWSRYVFYNKISGTSYFGSLFYYADSNNYYLFRIEASSGNFTLIKVVSGSPSSISSGSLPYAVQSDVWYGIRVHIDEEGSNNRIKIYVDGTEILNILDTNELTKGSAGFFNGANSTTKLDESELFELPLDTDLVDINT